MRSLNEIALADKDRRAIGDAARLLRALFPVEQVVLFGSKARGAGDAESDIDLLVLTSRRLDWREEEALIGALFDVEMAHDVVISPLIVPAAEWSQGVYRVLAIRGEVERDGVAA